MRLCRIWKDCEGPLVSSCIPHGFAGTQLYLSVRGLMKVAGMSLHSLKFCKCNSRRRNAVLQIESKQIARMMI